MALPVAPPLARLGPYELLRKLATGGMAEIYEARRVGPHGFSKRIAVKRILPQLAADAEFVAMFIDEARLCAQLSHPNLVQVFDFGEDEGELYMAMELVEGTTGAKLVRAAAGRAEKVPLDVALFIALSVARGLEHAHEACDEAGRPLRLVHRDVSPGNVLLSRSGAVKLGDFGIARAAHLERRTEQGQLKGKLGYMSPEQVVGRELDDKSDQFTVGIVLAEMLIAHPLFDGPGDMDILVKIRDADVTNLARHGSHVPEDVRGVLLRALARRPDDRFSTTRAFADAIEEVVRRRRLPVRPAALAAYLDRMGLVKPTGRSGEHVIDDLASTRPRQPSPDKARKLSGPRPVSSPPRASVPPGVRRAESRPPGDVAPSVYRLLTPDGMLGPLSFPRVVELFATGRAVGSTPVSRENGPFRPARQLAELERLCTTLAFRWDESIDRGATERVPIVDGEWPGRLVDLMLRRATGLLVVRDGARKKKVFFIDGAPEFTGSTEASELLGSMLVESGIALPMEIEMALALSPRYGGRLGDALVGLGVLRPMELCRALVAQTHRRFVELVGWREGEAAFLDGARSHEETMHDLVPPLHLVVQGIRERIVPDAIAAILAPLAEAPIAPATRPLVALGSLRLTRAEAAVLEAIDAMRTVTDVVAQCVRERLATEAEALRAIYAGLATGVVVSPDWPPGAARTSAPTLPAIE